LISAIEFRALLAPPRLAPKTAGSRLKSCRRKWSSSNKEGTNLTSIRVACTEARLLTVVDKPCKGKDSVMELVESANARCSLSAVIGLPGSVFVLAYLGTCNN